MSRPFAALALVALLAGCGGIPRTAVAPVPQTVSQGVSTQDRKTIRTGDQAVVVDSPVSAGRLVERMVLESGGFIEWSNSSQNGDVRVRGRVPAVQLDSLMSDVATLGSERRRHVTGTDVSDQHADLTARLQSTKALRDRIQQLLDRAATLQEVLVLEKEIARLQTEIDGLQARLDQLTSRAELAALDVSLERKRSLGPITLAGRGVVRLVAKLF